VCETTNSANDTRCVVCDRDRTTAEATPHVTVPPAATAPVDYAAPAATTATSEAGPKRRAGAFIGIGVGLLVLIVAAGLALSRSGKSSSEATTPTTEAGRVRTAATNPPTTAPEIVAVITDPADNVSVPMGPLNFVATLNPPAPVAEAALTIDGSRITSGPNATLTWDAQPGRHSATITIQLTDGRTVSTESITFTVDAPIALPTTAAPVTTTPAPAPAPAPSDAGPAPSGAVGTRSYRVNPRDYLPIRTAPRLSADETARIPTGDTVLVRCKQIGEVVSGPYGNDKWWLWVEWHGYQGWVTDQYVVTKEDRDDPRLVPTC
jgi:hypothetical protein